MIQATAQAVSKALSRIRNMLSRGYLTALAVVPPNTTTPTATVQLLSQETYAGIEFPQEYGICVSPPLDGTTEIIAGFFGGARDHGTVLKTNNRKAFALLGVTLQEGETIVFNSKTKAYVLIKADGSIYLKSTSVITVDAPLVTYTGNLLVKGDITDNYLTQTRTIAGMRLKYNGHTHGGAVGIPSTGEQM
jgi:phage gp45-like